MAQQHGHREFQYAKYRVSGWRRNRLVARVDVPPVRARDVLHSYVAGWAEVAPEKIISALADDYHLYDPLAGVFCKDSLLDYFACLAGRFGLSSASPAAELSVVLHSCGANPNIRGESWFWREAPRLGLSGESTIVIGPRGIRSERVTYDLNLASHILADLPIDASPGTHIG